MIITIISLVIVCLFLVLFYIERRRLTVDATKAEPVQEMVLDTIAAEPPPIPFDPIPEEEENTLPMANFNIAYEIVRGHERGFQIFPQDRGNRNSLGQLVGTNWGINAQVYETYLGSSSTE